MAKCAGCAKKISDGQINNHRARCKKAKVILGDSLRINQKIRERSTKTRRAANLPQNAHPQSETQVNKEDMPIDVLNEVCTLLSNSHQAQVPFLL